MKIRVGATTDVGRVRQNNEDSHLVSPPVFAVADGMGGAASGEIASGLAMNTLRDLVHQGNGHPQRLAEWVLAANRAIFDRAQERPDEAGMGTTITVVMADDARLRLAHVGDSRAYLLRGDELTQLTEDHTRVHRMLQEGLLSEEEAKVHPQRNVVTRALGIGETVQVDEKIVRVRDGDRLLLCSDGLSGMVSNDTIREILASTPDPQEASARLVDAANEAGGVDNITAVVLDVAEVPESVDDTLVEDVGPASGANTTMVAEALPPPAPPPPAAPVPEAPPAPAGVAATGRRSRSDRRALVIALAVIVIAGLAVGVAFALSGGGEGKPKATAQPAAQERAAVTSFDLKAEAALPGSGPIQPSVFPGLPQDLQALGAADGKVSDPLGARIDGYVDQSASAIRGLEAIDVAKLVPAGFGRTTADLKQVRSMFLDAMHGYQDVAGLMKRAAAATGKDRTTLVGDAKSEQAKAAAQYRSGYDALLAVWKRVGIAVPAISPVPSPSPQTAPSPTTAPTRGQGSKGSPTPTPHATSAPPKPNASCTTVPVIGGCVPSP